ncbi:hypothetical protein PABG_04956 [Paracoccidioides brasiliensis Pb03]|nr:hypothetical protein PABG_04956 [Paracoccidioides brasiliensis Pb03]
MPDSHEPASSSSVHRRLQNNTNPPLLQFPKLPSVPPPSSQSDAEAMTSDNHRFERPESSLSESWATLSASDMYSEDDSRSDQTDAASLVGHSVPDDVTSLEGRDDDSDEVDSADVQSLCSDPPPPPSLRRHIHEQNLEDSETTINPPYQLVSDSIEFVEPDNWPEETIELKHTVQVFSEAEIPDYLRASPYHFGDDHVSLTVRQTMAKHGLDLTKPFRALYVGDSKFKQTVLDKLGDVLVAGSDHGFSTAPEDSSRFHVVPASFGTGSNPNYAELLPIHVQLIVDECVSMTEKREDHKPVTIGLRLKNREELLNSTWTGSGYEIQSDTPWTLPDLAIFFIPQTENLVPTRIRSLCRTFMERHSVPCMIISETLLWSKANLMDRPDYRSLHVCLETRDKETGESRVVDRYPIDLKTFESIAPRQLNRNLASLLGHTSPTAVPKTVEAPKVGKFSERLQGWKRWLDMKSSSDGSHRFVVFGTPVDLDTAMGTLAIFIIFTGVVVIGAFFLHFITLAILNLYTHLFSMSTSSRLSGPASAATYLPPKTATTNTAETSLMPQSIRDLILPACTEKDSVDIDAYISKLTSPPDRQGNEPGSFQIHVIGDCHIIIKLPSRATSRQKYLKFDVTVTRDDQHIPFEQTRLFDGVYALRLPREDAYGLLNIYIATKAKPIIEQVTEVDFGTPWLKIANWKRAAQQLSSKLRKDLNAAQAGLSDVYSRMFADLHEMSDIIRVEAELASRDSLQRAVEAANSILKKSQKVSEEIKFRMRDRVTKSSMAFREKLSTVNRDAVRFAKEARVGVEKEAKRLLKNHGRSYDFNFTKRLAQNAQRVRSLQGMATAQKQAARLWQRLQSTSNGNGNGNGNGNFVKMKTMRSKCGGKAHGHSCRSCGCGGGVR